MIKFRSVETLKGNDINGVYDFDRYNFEVYTGFATKEYAVIVDFIENEVTGDCIAYGSWFDIEETECLFLLESLEKEDINRDFSSILKRINPKKMAQ